MKVQAIGLAALCALLAVPAAAGAAEKPAKKSGLVITKPPAGKGQVVFFRPSGPGMIVGCTVHEGETQVGKLGNGKYFVHVTDPGPHEYKVKSEAKDVLNLEVEPGETEFVRCKIGMGVMVGRPNLSPATKDDFIAKGAKLKMEKVKKAKGD